MSRICQRLLLSLLIVLIMVACANAKFVADGVKLVPLTSDGRSQAVYWAFHGNYISFVRKLSGGSQSELLIMRSDGTGQKRITPIGNPFFAQWSWDGKKLSYEFSNSPDSQSQSEVYVYDTITDKSISVSDPYPRSALDADDGPFWSVDDKYIVYKARPGASRKRQSWLANTKTGEKWRLLPARGQAKEQRWSTVLPDRVSMLIEASGNGYDVATVKPDGGDLTLLTNIGAQSVRNDSPRWSPTGDWIAFTSDIDMTQSERELYRRDCWIVRPDGSHARNLTNATSPSTQKQLSLWDPIWSWDGRWIICEGRRYDIQGNGIPTVFLIDPVNGGYKAIITTNPRSSSKIISIKSLKWSYDSSKIAVLSKQYTVRNWGPDMTFEKPFSVLSLYDIKTATMTDILSYDEDNDRKTILGDADRDVTSDISWSPDSRSILLSIAEIISKSDNILKPDVFRLDLPDNLIGSAAVQFDGPPMGRSLQKTIHKQDNANASSTSSASKAALKTGVSVVKSATSASKATTTKNNSVKGKNALVTQIIKPEHMTIAEATASLPTRYKQYYTQNTARNILLFSGPENVLKDLQKDLKLIDTPSTHILVDLLAVELTEEASRKLGLDWTYADGRIGLFQPMGKAIRDLTPDASLGGLTTYPGAGQIFYQGVGKLPREFFVRLDTLIQNGNGTILANPRTVAVSGSEAKIQIRKTLNYFFNEGYDTAGRPIVKKSDISADTEGQITSTLLADGRIHMSVDVKVGSFTFTSDTALPEQTNREAVTEVTVQEGETIVIGGLRQQEMSTVVTKVPLLGDIPLLGKLFQKRERNIKHSVLTIFITPHIMKPSKSVPEWPNPGKKNMQLPPIVNGNTEPKNLFK